MRFNGQIASMFNGVFGPLYEDASVLQPTFTGPEDDPVEGTPITHACKAQEDELKAHMIESSSIRNADGAYLVMKNSISTKPKSGWFLVFGGEESEILNVETDPADSYYVLLVKS